MADDRLEQAAGIRSYACGTGDGLGQVEGLSRLHSRGPVTGDRGESAQRKSACLQRGNVSLRESQQRVRGRNRVIERLCAPLQTM